MPKILLRVGLNRPLKIRAIAGSGLRIRQSPARTVVAWILIRISWRVGAGLSTSWSCNTSGGPYLSYTIAFIHSTPGRQIYQATDTNLDRDVALKVLPQTFTDDLGRLARFEREAKFLASLNHPNIGHIYGLEEAEGQKALGQFPLRGPG